MEEKQEHQQTPKESSLEKMNQHVDKCLSVILHHPEIEELAEIIKEVYTERLKTGSNILLGDDNVS